MFIYPQLKQVRQKQQKTQKEIADYLHIKYQQYQRYENGTREMPIHMVHMLCCYYHVKIDELIGEIVYKSTKEEL